MTYLAPSVGYYHSHGCKEIALKEESLAFLSPRTWFLQTEMVHNLETNHFHDDQLHATTTIKWKK